MIANKRFEGFWGAAFILVGNLFDHILPAFFVLYQHHKVFKKIEDMKKQEQQKQDTSNLLSPTNLNSSIDEEEFSRTPEVLGARRTSIVEEKRIETDVSRSFDWNAKNSSQP